MNAMPQIDISNPRLASKTARHQCIAEILERNEVSSQSQLSELLEAEGHVVTQATLSRDLDELGAFKSEGNDGMIYVIAQDGSGAVSIPATESFGRQRLERVAHELLTSAAGSANIAVLRTPPGAAQYLASVIDHSVVPEMIGCVAGDDTIMVVTAEPDGGQALAEIFIEMASRKATKSSK